MKRNVQVASLSLVSAPQDISTVECDAVTGLIVGGVKAKSGEFPHMAAIGYPNIDNKIVYLCGGSLISNLFVLTAAHCKTADRLKPTMIRLGDLNLKVKENDLPEVDIPIEAFIAHEAYDRETQQNDIAVIRMEQAVIFNKFLRPACLKQSDNIAEPEAVASGWGTTEYGTTKTSEHLMKVQLNVLSNDICVRAYEDEIVVNRNQMCAGVLTGNLDTCQGGNLSLKN